MKIRNSAGQQQILSMSSFNRANPIKRVDDAVKKVNAAHQAFTMAVDGLQKEHIQETAKREIEKAAKKFYRDMVALFSNQDGQKHYSINLPQKKQVMESERAPEERVSSSPQQA